MGDQPTQPGQPAQPQQGQQIQQGVTQVIGGLISALQAAGVTNAQALQPLLSLFGSLITVAATTGVITPVSAVGYAVTLATSILGILMPSGTNAPSAVATQLQTLQTQLTNIGQGIMSGNFSATMQTIQNNLSTTTSAIENLPTLASGVPLLKTDIATNLKDITNSLNSLAPPDLSGPTSFPQPLLPANSVWMVPSEYQVYWDDGVITAPSIGLWLPTAKAWYACNAYGQQAPPTALQVEGNVFNYTYILPVYTWIVSVFLSVGAVIDPEFTDKDEGYGNTINSVADLLDSVHDYIVNKGFTQLSPGGFDYQTLSGWLNSVSSAKANDMFCPRGAAAGFFDSGPAGIGGPLGIQIEFGTVETFSGYSSVAIYSLAAPLPPDDSYYNKFQIRQAKRYKDVYLGSGLLTLWSAINKLKTLVGEPPLPGPSKGDWSFRRDIVGPANVSTPTGTSLLAVAKFIKNTPPADTPSKALWTSFRDLLEV